MKPAMYVPRLQWDFLEWGASASKVESVGGGDELSSGCDVTGSV